MPCIKFIFRHIIEYYQPTIPQIMVGWLIIDIIIRKGACLILVKMHIMH